MILLLILQSNGETATIWKKNPPRRAMALQKPYDSKLYTISATLGKLISRS